jgi:hypothetical protein
MKIGKISYFSFSFKWYNLNRVLHDQLLVSLNSPLAWLIIVPDKFTSISLSRQNLLISSDILESFY